MCIMQVGICTGTYMYTIQVSRYASVVYSQDCDADLLAIGDVLPCGGFGSGDLHLLAGQDRGVWGGGQPPEEGSHWAMSMCRRLKKSESFNASCHSQMHFCPSLRKVHCTEPLVRVRKEEFKVPISSV